MVQPIKISGPVLTVSATTHSLVGQRCTGGFMGVTCYYGAIFRKHIKLHFKERGWNILYI